MRKIGLYIHIPFCHARCGYCDFATFVHKEGELNTYLKALELEMGEYERFPVETLFIGGGTPTVLTPESIRQLHRSLNDSFDLTFLKEATIEANPESTHKDNLLSFREMGINRISFGVQTSQNNLLQAMDRLHSWEQFLKAYQLAQDLGFRNFNFDLIFGLPGQSFEDWNQTVRDILALNPNHLSLYALKVEPGTAFDKAGICVNDDLQADMYLFAAEKIQQAGFHHYEISNFAKQGFECQHNLKYWENQETLGIGLSSASYLGGKRFTNPRGWKDYCNPVLSQKKPPREVSALGPNEKEKEDIMLKLRLHKGVEWPHIEKLNLPIFKDFERRGLASLKNEHYFLRPEGWLLSNELFQYLV